MRVLLVEDIAMNRRVIRDMLTIAGIMLEEASDAETGLRMIDQENFSAILMDLRMPGMDGFEAIRRIRARGDDKAKVPIIVVTADTSDDIRAACLRYGADELLTKPIALRPLFKSVAARTLRASETDVVTVS